MSRYYTRDLQPTDDLMAALGGDTRVAHTDLGNEIEVSTVFLGIDHNFSGLGKPVLFETMVFNGPLDQEMNRYCTEAAAREGHKRMVQRVREQVSA